MFSRHLLAQAPLKRHFMRSLWLFLLWITSSCASWAPFLLHCCQCLFWVQFCSWEELQSSEVPRSSGSPFLQDGKHQLQLGQSFSSRPSKKPLGRPRSSEGSAGLYLWQAAGHSLPPSSPACFPTFPWSELFLQYHSSLDSWYLLSLTFPHRSWEATR